MPKRNFQYNFTNNDKKPVKSIRKVMATMAIIAEIANSIGEHFDGHDEIMAAVTQVMGDASEALLTWDMLIKEDDVRRIIQWYSEFKEKVIGPSAYTIELTSFCMTLLDDLDNKIKKNPEKIKALNELTRSVNHLHSLLEPLHDKEHVDSMYQKAGEWAHKWFNEYIEHV